MKNELVLRARRAVCPSSGRDGAATFFVADGHIVQIADEWVENLAVGCIDIENAVLIPGLVDLHAHVDLSGQSRFGVDADAALLPGGTTTVGSQGDVGADGIDQYQEKTIGSSNIRVRLAINFSRTGEAGSEAPFAKADNADVAACVAAIENHRDSIWAIAVNLSHHSCGKTPPRPVLVKALEAARQADLPLLVGLRRPEDWPLAAQLELLRAGDVVTYCFRKTPHCLMDRGSVLPEFLAARQRGVLFDVGHGRGSFDFRTAELAIAAGFPPDTISTDYQKGHLDQPQPHGLLQVLAKLQAVGMSWESVLAAATCRPAQLLSSRREASGELTVGCRADFAALADPPTRTTLWDTSGASRQAPLHDVKLVVCQGEVIVAR